MLEFGSFYFQSKFVLGVQFFKVVNEKLSKLFVDVFFEVAVVRSSYWGKYLACIIPVFSDFLLVG